MKVENSFTWIKNSKVQLEWLNTYLHARLNTYELVCIDGSDNTVVDKFVEQITKSKSGDTLELFNTKARTAWNQHARRLKRKSSHVTSSFEIEKSTYKQLVKIAKKYNIPITLAVEELLKKGCELAEEASNLNKIKKSMRNGITKRSRNKIFNNPSSREISKESLIKAFSKEAYERHILKLEYLNLTDNQKGEVDKATNEEVNRYNSLCNEFNLLNLKENS